MISYALCVMRRRIRLSMYSLVKMPSHPELAQNDSHNSRDTGLRIKMCDSTNAMRGFVMRSKAQTEQ